MGEGYRNSMMFPGNIELEVNDALRRDNANLRLQLQEAQGEIDTLRARQRWLDEVARPNHPDDERPWAAAYLDMRARVKTLEEALLEIYDIYKNRRAIALNENERRIYAIAQAAITPKEATRDG